MTDFNTDHKTHIHTVKLLIQAESQIEAGAPIQAGRSEAFVLIEAGACIRSFTVDNSLTL